MLELVPDWIRVLVLKQQLDSVRAWYYCTRDDVVSVTSSTRIWLTDTIELYWRCSDNRTKVH
jgi:hypothetical protein